MNVLEATLRRIPTDMKAVGVDWALVGGFAVSAYAGGRATADIDLAVAIASDAEVDRIVFGLTRLGYEVGPVLEDTESGRTATVRLFSPIQDERKILVDLLINTSGIEDEVVRAAQKRRIRPGFELPIASLGHLIALKVLSESDSRLQDRIDLRNLVAEATNEDAAVARAAIRLITERGRNREKDLDVRLNEFLASEPNP